MTYSLREHAPTRIGVGTEFGLRACTETALSHLAPVH